MAFGLLGLGWLSGTGMFRAAAHFQVWQSRSDSWISIPFTISRAFWFQVPLREESIVSQDGCWIFWGCFGKSMGGGSVSEAAGPVRPVSWLLGGTPSSSASPAVMPWSTTWQLWRFLPATGRPWQICPKPCPLHWSDQRLGTLQNRVD